NEFWDWAPQPSVNFSSLMIFATLFSLVINILEKLVQSTQTLSKAMVARNGFSQGEKGEDGETRFGGERVQGMGFFGGGLEQDIDDLEKKRKRRREDDEESKICCGLNNRGGEERWKSMALSEKGARSGLSK
ncbi:hypothetical protein Tco_1569561, partial [Tanacetum coccineum]